MDAQPAPAHGGARAVGISIELALTLEPTDSFDLALARLAETTEARKLFSVQDIGIGGAHDIRPGVDLAARGGVLDPQQLLDIK